MDLIKCTLAPQLAAVLGEEAYSGHTAVRIGQDSASGREYHRLSYGNRSWVLQGYRRPTGDLEKFVRLGRALESAGLPVASVLAEDYHHGQVLLEDLGDVRMADLAVSPGTDIPALYDKALDLLTRWQGLFGEVSLAVPAQESQEIRARELMSRALCYTGQYTSSEGVYRCLHWLTDAVSRHPVTLQHGDFHAKNLMIDRSGALRLLDYQAASIGSAYYDLATLLWDPCVGTMLPSHARDLFNLWVRTHEQGGWSWASLLEAGIVRLTADIGVYHWLSSMGQHYAHFSGMIRPAKTALSELLDGYSSETGMDMQPLKEAIQ